MKNINRFKVLAVFFAMTLLLAACGGALPQTVSSARGPKVEANTVVAFNGIVEAMNGTEWTINGQKISLDPQALLDPNIAVGDEVKVEANVSADGSIVVMKVESAGRGDTVSTASVEDNSTPDPVEMSAPDVRSASEGSNSSDNSAPQAAGTNENEVFGTVEAITADTIIVDGVTYDLTDFTEIKDALTAGDTVKLHVTVNADGTVTVREIEKSVTSFSDNGSNSGAADGPNHDANDDKSGGNSSNDGSNHNSNDNHGGNSGSGGSGKGGG
ncbi:MAG TPA: DUF5666 domain-containing protein [Anaerolineales bacterium]|nr:DUF5666 domain-containing protein [Anaerolineales bacterium]